ncbi:myosin heavy chain, clone 203-like [Xiphophorus maculatus]|uniref:myosin heavy chain, clone 203-like n=1 Tax=Xiphophorus maculatus TaxID=8083 RepID=UPI000C6D5AC5|nr:myosin heavy chain, clone 203-like [Xiphophorus maculatus]
MPPINTYFLTECEIKEMSRDELIVVILDFIQRFKKIAKKHRSGTAVEEELQAAQEEIVHLNQNIGSLKKKLDESHRQNKNLICKTIPKLQREIKNQRSHRNQLLIENKNYQTKFKSLHTCLNNLADSKLQLERTLAEKREAMSQLTAYRMDVEKQENEVEKLQFELYKKNNYVDQKNIEIKREKEKSRSLEVKIKDLEKQLNEAKNQMKIPGNRLSKTLVGDAYKYEPSATFSDTVLFQKKVQNRVLATYEKARAIQEEEPLKKQAESHSTLSALKQQESVKLQEEDLRQQQEAMGKERSFHRTEFDCKRLKEEIQSLNGQIQALTQSRHRDQECIKNLTKQVNTMKTKYYREKKEYEDLNKSIKRKETKVQGNIAAEIPNNETQTNDQQAKRLPSIDGKSVCGTLPLGGGRLNPELKEEKLITIEKLNLSPIPPSKKKLEMPSFALSGRKIVLREPEQRKNSGPSGRRATVDGNVKVPSLEVKGNKPL